MRRDSITFPHSGFSQELNGVNKMKMDGKNRVNIPMEWRHVFTPGTDIVFIYNGKYGLILLPTVYDRLVSEQKLNIELISPSVYKWKMDGSGRLQFSDGFISINKIPKKSDLHLVGFKTSIKVFFNENEFQEFNMRSQELMLKVTEKADSLL